MKRPQSMAVAFSLFAAVVLLTSCGQAGNEDAAAAAADNFVELLVAERAGDAWDTLTPATRTAAYGDDFGTFAGEVRNADWAPLRWRIGPVVDYDISWGVYVEVEGGELPAFLTSRNIAAGSRDQLVLMVQIRRDGSHAVAGVGLDRRE
jgi:hypothetical protein